MELDEILPDLSFSARCLIEVSRVLAEIDFPRRYLGWKLILSQLRGGPLLSTLLKNCLHFSTRGNHRVRVLVAHTFQFSRCYSSHDCRILEEVSQQTLRNSGDARAQAKLEHGVGRRRGRPYPTGTYAPCEQLAPAPYDFLVCQLASSF